MRKLLYIAPVGLDKKGYESDVFIDELLTRLKLTYGSYHSGLNRFGIVSAGDPRKGTSTDLLVTASTTNFGTVDINAGTAVFANGEIITFEQNVVSVPLADSSINAINVVYLQFDEELTTPALTRSNVLTNTQVVYLADPSLYVKVVTLATYQGYNSEDLITKIPLAVVTALSVGSPPFVDSTTTSLATNRPWFSPVDVEHRSKVGTGTVTDSNPHGLSLNDLTAGSKSFFQLSLDQGMIVAKDIAYPKVPGHICTDNIEANTIRQDTTGTITGVPNSWYLYLTKIPTQLLRTTDFDTQTVDIAAALVPRRNMVILLNSDEHLVNPTTSKKLTISYLAVDALRSPITPNIASAYTVSSPFSNDETIIAGGALLASTQSVHSFTDAVRFPSLYQLFTLSDGIIYKNPHVLYCAAALSAIGTALQPITVPMLGPSKLRVGLTGAVFDPTLNVQVRVSGTSEAGGVLYETITFTNSNWNQDIAVGEYRENNIANSKLYQLTTNTFATVTSVQIVNPPVSVGSNSYIAVWSVLDPVTTRAIADMLPIADVVWDGNKIANDGGNNPKIEDIRPIATKLQAPKSSRWLNSADLVGNNSGSSRVVQAFSEDFDSPRYLSSKYVTESVGTPVPASKVTKTSRVYEGLHRSDLFVSRPIPIRPTGSVTPNLLRIVPIGVGSTLDPAYSTTDFTNFSLYVRVFAATNGWSSWYQVTKGYRSLDIALSAVNQNGTPFAINNTTNTLVKVQFVAQGSIRGVAGVVFASADPGVGNPTSGLLYDIGIWNELQVK